MQLDRRLWGALVLAAVVAGVLTAPLVRAAPSNAVAQGDQGLNAGWAVDDGGNIDFDVSVSYLAPTMAQAGAGWVRVNFRLGGCFSNWTAVGCNGQTALQTYDRVVARAHAQHLKILGLLMNESWSGDQTAWTANNAENNAGASGDNPYIQTYAQNVAAILAQHFAGTIGVWEVWSEPNAWTSSPAPGQFTGGSYMYPSNYAWLLRRSYSAIKSAQPGATVVFGGLLAHEPGGVPATILVNGRPRQVVKRADMPNARHPMPATRAPAAPTVACGTSVPSGADSGASYLCAAYSVGRGFAGWQAGATPFDDVGQHPYVAVGTTLAASTLSTYMQDLRDAYVAYEGAATAKRVQVTELGWPTDQVTPQVQSDNLRTAFQTLQGTPWVARSYWFNTEDNVYSTPNLLFGLVDRSLAPKLSFSAYQTYATFTQPVSSTPIPTSTPTLTSTATPTATPTSTPITVNAYATIEAESFKAKSAQPQAEPAADVGGGLDMGYIHTTDWLQFDSVNFGTTPATQLIARIASGVDPSATGQIEVHLDSLTGPSIGTLTVVNTGGWQAWRTLSAAIAPTTGTHSVFLAFTSASSANFVNVNWFAFSASASPTATSTLTPTATATSTSTPNTVNAYATIEAESFRAKSAQPQPEPAADVGGGLDMGYIHTTDWLQFDSVNFGTTPATQLIARIASGVDPSATGQIEVHLDSLTGPSIGTLTVVNTGGWQAWRTLSAAIAPTTGTHTVFLAFTSASSANFVNVNWFAFSASASPTATSTLTPTATATPTSTPSTVNAYATIEAESFKAKSAQPQAEPAADVGGGLDMGYIHTTDWLQFNNVSFGTTPATQFIARIASGVGAGPTGQVEVRLDSLNSPSIGTLAIADTGGWQAWRTASGTIAATTSTHTVYLVFTAPASSNFVNVNWFVFGH